MVDDDLSMGPAEVIVRELNARAAFEIMLAASLKAAALSGVVAFVLGFVASIADGFVLTSLAGVAVHGVGLALLVFFGGFIGAIVAGVPLFLFLERSRVRRGLPYVLAALLVNAVIFVILTGAPPSIGDPVSFLYLLPGVTAALYFLQGVAPIWRRPLPAPPVSNVVRLH